MSDTLNEEQISVLADYAKSGISKSLVESQLNHVINFYQKTPNVEKDYGCGIFQISNHNNFPSIDMNKLANSLSDEFQKEIVEEMLDWETYMYCKENEERKQCSARLNLNFPIRNQDCSNIVIQSLPKSYRNNIYNNSYHELGELQYELRENWDLEIDEERKTKRERLALENKAIGNQYFGKKMYREAIEYYTKSLNQLPSAESFNNRAMSYIKLKNFSAAMKDSTEVLKMEPKNVKALFRRATARKEMMMFEEALKDIRLGMELGGKLFLNLSNEVKNEISKLNGRKYNILSLYGSKKSFEIDVSQLMAYANSGEPYILEVDKTGCTRSCVCGYCTEENRRERTRSAALRIKERERWKLLTSDLLNEMKITQTAVSKRNDNSSVITETSSSVLKNDISPQTNPTRPNESVNLDIIKLKNVANCKINELEISNQTCSDVETLLAKIESYDGTDESGRHMIRELKSVLKNNKVSDLRNVFQNRHLNEKLFITVLEFAIDDFQLNEDWCSFHHILEALSSVDEFSKLIKLVDESTKNDLRNLLDKAAKSNLIHAGDLMKNYC